MVRDQPRSREGRGSPRSDRPLGQPTEPNGFTKPRLRPIRELPHLSPPPTRGGRFYPLSDNGGLQPPWRFPRLRRLRPAGPPLRVPSFPSTLLPPYPPTPHLPTPSNPPHYP